MTPINAVTGQPCAGKNVARLLEAAAAHGWSDLRFLTYVQAKSVGAQVRKGEHGVRSVAWSSMQNRQPRRWRCFDCGRTVADGMFGGG